MTTLTIAVVGARGRMGRAIVRLAEEEGVQVVLAIDVGDDLASLGKEKPDVAIDFSSPASTRALANAAADAGVAIVSGTTGLDDETMRALERASKVVPVLWEPNMSLGVHVLGELVRRAASALGPGFDIEIVEAHHRRKVDSPSGTAVRLAEIAGVARGDGPRMQHGREGRPGMRPAAEIGMHAVRGGDVIGDHTVMFLGMGERIELSHRASNRDLFAHGALRAARFVAHKPSGRYALADLAR